jgi:hypothetical protein
MQNGQAALRDSLVHIHSGGRVSYGLPEVEIPYNPNDGVYTADQSTRVENHSFPLPLVDRMTRVFNSMGQITEYRELVKPINIYIETYKEWYHYNQSLQRDTMWSTDGQVSSRLVYVYQNNIQVAGLYETYNPTGKTWELAGIDSFVANGTDSLYKRYWKNTTMQLVESNKYQRDANGRVVTDSFFKYNTLTRITHTTYDTSGRKANDSVFTGSPVSYGYKKIYLYDNSSNLISINQYMWDNNSNSYTTRHKDTMTYNVVNQLTSVQSYTLDGSTWIPKAASQSRFYYYGFPASVNDVAGDNNLRLCPIPATSYINLDVSFDRPEKFSLRMLDMQGRIVRQWDEPAQASYKKRIQLDGMPAGNYIVHVLSASQIITRQFNILQ